MIIANNPILSTDVVVVTVMSLTIKETDFEF